MIDNLEGTSDAGRNVMSLSGWNPTGIGTNSNGFNAYPAASAPDGFGILTNWHTDDKVDDIFSSVVILMKD